MASTYEYVGSELELFSHAVNWKAYLRDQMGPYVRGDVLEVGAGIGGTTEVLCNADYSSWTCLEPDERLAGMLRERKEAGVIPTPAEFSIEVGTTEGLHTARSFDAILYVDVLEHIADDVAEVRCSAELLRPQGNLIVLAPAHEWLYSPFDAAIGHVRRYDRRSLGKLAPPELRLCRVRYLDSIGLFASLSNRWLLRAKLPGIRQIRFWDRVMVPCSRPLDWLLRYRWGKSLLAVWERVD
jgi:SAM-dependent methyltransferase